MYCTHPSQICPDLFSGKQESTVPTTAAPTEALNHLIFFQKKIWKGKWITLGNTCIYLFSEFRQGANFRQRKGKEMVKSPDLLSGHIPLFATHLALDFSQCCCQGSPRPDTTPLLQHSSSQQTQEESKSLRQRQKIYFQSQHLAATEGEAIFFGTRVQSSSNTCGMLASLFHWNKP